MTTEVKIIREREKQIQKRIAKDPEILGLGKMTLYAVEKRQINGRLDLQFKGEDLKTRYEVELQLGKLDNDHLMRCVHYWNYERCEHPQYKHYAVIVAEEIPDYMIDAINLFKAPIIAIKISIDEANYKITANKLNDFPIYEWPINDSYIGKEEENDDKPFHPPDWAYLETVWSEVSLKELDDIYMLAKETIPETGMNITKRYIGFTADDFYSYMFVESKGDSLIIKPVLDQLSEIDNMIQEAGLKSLGYRSYKNKRGYYQIRIDAGDIEKTEKVLRELIKMSYEKWRNNKRDKNKNKERYITPLTMVS